MKLLPHRESPCRSSVQEPGIGGVGQYITLLQPHPFLLHHRHPATFSSLPRQQHALQYVDQVWVGEHRLQHLLLLLGCVSRRVPQVLLENLVVLELGQHLLSLQLLHLLLLLGSEHPHLGVEGTARAPPLREVQLPRLLLLLLLGHEHPHLGLEGACWLTCASLQGGVGRGEGGGEGARAHHSREGGRGHGGRVGGNGGVVGGAW